MAKPISAVHHISTNISAGCPVCSAHLKAHEDFDGAVNHMIGHGWTVEHIGSETIHDEHGKPWHTTVAVVAQR
jgi:hypothetical protein